MPKLDVLSLLSAYSVDPSWIQEALHALVKDGEDVNMYCTLNAFFHTLLKECSSTFQIIKCLLWGSKNMKETRNPKGFFLRSL